MTSRAYTAQRTAGESPESRFLQEAHEIVNHTLPPLANGRIGFERFGFGHSVAFLNNHQSTTKRVS